MIIDVDKLKEVANKVLSAVDSSEISTLTETLAIKAVDDTFYISVTNRKYFVKIKLNVKTDVPIYATVNANLFLKLISQTTTPDIEMYTSNNSLIIKGNGTYKLPMIYSGDELLEIPEITINNKTCEMDIPTSILYSINQYNSKELKKGKAIQPVQKLYYIDNEGALTFTSGACVNNFNLDKPIKILVDNKIVKLFKLFTDETVHLILGHDALQDDTIQTKLSLISDDVILTTILTNDDKLINSVPVNAIRGRANKVYPYSVDINKDTLLQIINRLMLFNSSEDKLVCGCVFEFGPDKVTIWDPNKENCEYMDYLNKSSGIDSLYTAKLNYTDLKITLETCTDHYLTMRFGDKSAFVFSKGNIHNIIPEVRLMR